MVSRWPVSWSCSAPPSTTTQRNLSLTFSLKHKPHHCSSRACQRWKAREEGVRVGGGARAEELWLSNTAVAAEEAEAEAEGRWPRFK